MPQANLRRSAGAQEHQQYFPARTAGATNPFDGGKYQPWVDCGAKPIHAKLTEIQKRKNPPCKVIEPTLPMASAPFLSSILTLIVSAEGVLLAFILEEQLPKEKSGPSARGRLINVTQG